MEIEPARIAILLRGAIVAVGLATALSGYEASASNETVRELFGRIEKAYERLIDAMEEKLDKERPVSKEEVRALWVRGFEYYKHRDYFTAARLLRVGLAAWGNMRWPEDETYQRASFYEAVSEKRFCLDEEIGMCQAYEGLKGGARYLRVVDDICRRLAYVTENVPADLADEARRHCLDAHGERAELCRADKSGNSACQPYAGPPCR